MTSIVYRDGILAADSGHFSGNLLVCRESKITRAPDGTIGACCGSAHSSTYFDEWLITRREAPFEVEDEDFYGLFITSDGRVHSVNCHGELFAFPTSMEWFSIGVAIEFTQGALAAGATARQACELACLYVKGCAGPVETAEVWQPKPAVQRFPIIGEMPGMWEGEV